MGKKRKSSAYPPMTTFLSPKNTLVLSLDTSLPELVTGEVGVPAYGAMQWTDMGKLNPISIDPAG